MARVFFPGCKVKNRYPEASAWLAEQVVERGYADEVTGCCRINHQKLTPEDTAVCICNNCMAMIDEDAAERGIFVPHEPDEIQKILEAHVAAIEPDEVVCYCTACDSGLEAGGAQAHNIIELVSGKFCEPAAS